MRAVDKTEEFADAIAKHIDDSEDLMKARATLFAMLMSTAGAGLATAASEELLHADTLSRLEVATRVQGVELAEAKYADLEPVDAINFFRKKRVMTPRELSALEDAYLARGFAVAGLQQRYALERVHGLLSEAIERGTTKRDFVRQLNTQFDKWGLTRLGDHHVRTVFDTNLASAYAAGRFAQMQRVRKARPYWQYKTAGDRRVRPSHAAMNGRVFRADDPVWDRWFPPNGFRCRCTVVSVSKDELERDGLKVDQEPPGQVEVDGQVHQVVPDMGFGGSPRVQARADEAVQKLRKRARKLGALRAPELTPIAEMKPGRPAPPVHNSAGDLLRIEDARRARVVDRYAGLSPDRAESLAREQPFFNVFKKGELGRVPKGEAWVEVPLYSQNLDTAEQLVRRVAGEPGIGHLVGRMQVSGRASYGAYDTARWIDPEVVWDAAGARRLGYTGSTTMSRSTAAVLRFPVKSDAELEALIRTVRQAETGHGAAVRRAWETGDFRVRGSAADVKGFERAFLNRRNRGSGEQVVLSRGGPIPGWRSEPVQVNARLFEFLPDYSV